MKRNEGDSGNCNKERHWKVTFTTGRLVQSSMRKFIDCGQTMLVILPLTMSWRSTRGWKRTKNEEDMYNLQIHFSYFTQRKRRAKLQDRPRYPAVLAIEWTRIQRKWRQKARKRYLLCCRYCSVRLTSHHEYNINEESQMLLFLQHFRRRYTR